jgi:predicted small lipoprotein YifL
MSRSSAMASATRMMLGLLGVLALAACGQKGPLYLPDQGGEVVTRPASQPSTQSRSPETAPQPATQAPPDTTTKPEDEKKSATPR